MGTQLRDTSVSLAFATLRANEHALTSSETAAVRCNAYSPNGQWFAYASGSK